MDINKWISVFQQSINDYHQYDAVNQPADNPYAPGSPEHLFYTKNWVDTVQWHLEDLIRNPEIDPAEALHLKRRIDASNQQRTDLVEFIDGWFAEQFSHITPAAGATMNTETPAWAIDRLSILELKIFHMAAEAERTGAPETHRATCRQKLDVLLLQRHDLSVAITQLLHDIATGKKYMKLYKQMKMYNDESLNPVLYAKKK